MAPPPGQTNRDTSAADHTTCFYCHQQLILVSHKVIVSRDAHGCSIRICEPCEKEARRRRPTSRRRASHPSHLAGGPLGRPTTPWSRRWRAGRRARHRAESRRRRLASFAVLRGACPTPLRRRSRSRRRTSPSRPCASSWAAPPTKRRRRVTNQLCLNLTCSTCGRSCRSWQTFPRRATRRPRGNRRCPAAPSTRRRTRASRSRRTG